MAEVEEYLYQFDSMDKSKILKSFFKVDAGILRYPSVT